MLLCLGAGFSAFKTSHHRLTAAIAGQGMLSLLRSLLNSVFREEKGQSVYRAARFKWRLPRTVASVGQARGELACSTGSGQAVILRVRASVSVPRAAAKGRAGTPRDTRPPCYNERFTP